MSVPPHETPLAPQSVLAERYRLVRRLGRGGMGEVWEGVQVTTDKPVAIKVLLGRSAPEVSRFLREAKVAAGLSHRNIVQVFDCWGSEGGPTFLVMELLRGITLARRLEAPTPLALDDALGIAVAVARGLRVAHEAGVVHRDVKPDNVFLAEVPGGEIEIKVLDFGIAKVVDTAADATAMTQTGSLLGTPSYMAPEQVYGQKDIDAKADVWALGVVLYQCVLGTLPFVGENFGQVFRSITQDPVRPLRETLPAVPPPLEDLVLRMLSRDRATRPSMGEVGGALEGLLRRSAAPLRASTTSILPPQSETLSARTVALEPTPPANPTAMPVAFPSTSSPPPAKAKRGAMPLLLAGAGLSVFLGIVALAGSMAIRPEAGARVSLPPVPTVPSATASASASIPAPSALASPSVSASALASVSASPAPVAAPPAARAPKSRPSPVPTASTRAAPPPSDPLGGGRF